MSNPFITPQTSTNEELKSLVAGTPKVASAARWFWWIAGLSAVNTLLLNFGSNTSFVIGLGFTLIADAFFQAFKPAAFVIDIVAIGFFYAMGHFSLRGHRWAFIVGAVVYALDALIYVYFQDFMPVAFHAWALFCIISGFIALNTAINQAKLNTLNATNLSPAPTSPAAVSPLPETPNQT
jgi:hypothetical protein